MRKSIVTGVSIFILSKRNMTMDFQTMVDAMMSKARMERLANSSQLLLGELKLKLSAVSNKTKPIVFDFGMKPAGARSWRGSYSELGLEYSENGGGEAHWDSDRVVHNTWGDSFENDVFKLKENPSCGDFLEMLEALTNKTMTGYKGGDFVMHKNVAIYLGNYGESGVSGYPGDEEYPTVAPVDVEEAEEKVIIVTKAVEY